MRRYAPLLAALIALAPAACKKKQPAGGSAGSAGSSAGSSSAATGPIKGSVVKIVTSMGDITVQLDREKAPLSSENFLRYVKAGFYDGTIFHRVIPTFMIQGGGFTSDFRKKSTRAPIRNEADNGLSNERGTIAMARTRNPHSATAQFYINVKDNDALDHKAKTFQKWGYAVFGKVIAGMDVVDKIKSVATGAKGPFRVNCPQEDVVIKKATIVR